ncbi:MAG: hypothetical protein LBC74_02535 [Planctomycetaceae bacterium]|jgi:type IV secretory pathway VirB10-like protein|nr:hypothetical protein [Planctomycetaceae bacterium]
MKRIIVTKNIIVNLCERMTGGMSSLILMIIVLSILLSGCEGAKPKQRPDANQPEKVTISETKKTDDKKTDDKKVTDKPQVDTPKPKDKGITEEKPEPAKKVETKKPETVVKAEVGAGAKGHYGGEKHVMAPLLVPLGTYWRASEMTTYNIKIPKAMQLYKANHDNKAPATHEEFMEEIIKKEMIKLPQLPAGHRYVYDPTDEQLKIAKPAN